MLRWVCWRAWDYIAAAVAGRSNSTIIIVVYQYRRNSLTGITCFSRHGAQLVPCTYAQLVLEPACPSVGLCYIVLYIGIRVLSRLR